MEGSPLTWLSFYSTQGFQLKKQLTWLLAKLAIPNIAIVKCSTLFQLNP